MPRAGLKLISILTGLTGLLGAGALAWAGLPPPASAPPATAPEATPESAAAGLLVERPAPPPPRRPEGSFRTLTAAIGVSAGMQYDSRPCTLAGTSSSGDGIGPCLIFAGGVDLSLLWQGRLGGMVGIFSASGQSVITKGDTPQSQSPPGIPDRVSLPLAMDVRPLGFFSPAGDTSYLGRVLHGIGIRLGPSLEVVRTASDLAAGVGLYLGLQVELPLHAAPRNGLSLRFSSHILYAPQMSLNDGMVRSTPFDDCVLSMPGCISPSEHRHGYAGVYQTYFGLVYYP